MNRTNRRSFGGRAWALLGLGAIALAVRGDSCITEEKYVDVVVTVTAPIVWHTAGTHEAGADTDFVAIADDIDQAIDDYGADLDSLDAIHVSGMTYEVLDNSGVIGAHQGTITIEATGQTPLEILTYDVPNPPGNTAGATGGSGIDVQLQEPGLTFLNDRLAAYLASGRANDSLLEFTFKTNWTSTNPAPGHYDFHWQTAVVVQIVGEIKVTVPNP